MYRAAGSQNKEL